MIQTKNDLLMSYHRKSGEGHTASVDEDGHFHLKVAVYETGLKNEIWEAVWHQNRPVQNHRHTHATETFFVMKGRTQITIGGIRTIMNAGDIVHVPERLHHEFLILDEETVWINMFCHLHYYGKHSDMGNLKKYHPEKYSEHKWINTIKRMIDSDDLPAPDFVEGLSRYVKRPHDYERQFEFFGIRIGLKVGLWETFGYNEVWEMVFPQGMEIVVTEPMEAYFTLVVTAGKIDAQVGNEAFTAERGDIIQIPTFVPSRFTMLEPNTAWLTYGCETPLIDLMEELQYLKNHEPENFSNSEIIQAVLKKHRVQEINITGSDDIE